MRGCVCLGKNNEPSKEGSSGGQEELAWDWVIDGSKVIVLLTRNLLGSLEGTLIYSHTHPVVSICNRPPPHPHLVPFSPLPFTIILLFVLCALWKIEFLGKTILNLFL